MSFKVILLIIIFFSSIFLNGCGRKDIPLKPSEVVIKK